MMNSWIDLEWIAGGLLFWSLIAAALVLIGEGLNRGLGHWAASYRHAIWLAIAICVLAVPVVSNLVPGMLPSTAYEMELGPSKETRRTESVSLGSDLPELDNNSALSAPKVDNLASDDSYSGPEQNPLPTRRPSRSPTLHESLFPFLYQCIAGCWIAGSSIYLLRTWRARKQLAKAFCQSQTSTDESIANLVAKLAREEGLMVVASDNRGTQGTGARHIALTVTKSEVGPLIWGFMPARLLVPLSLSELPSDSQEAAIRHEFAHVARGDEWVRRYLVLLRAVFWFHPMVRYCCDQVQLFAEKACDDQVLRFGHRPSAYSELLLKLGQRQSGMKNAFVISGMAQSQITSRITSILDSSSSRRPMTWRGALAVAATMLVATGVLSTLRPSAAVERDNTEKPPTVSGADDIQKLKVGAKDWPQWAGSSVRNNVTSGQKIPLDWDVKSGRNIRWSMPIGTAYGGVVVANGKVFAGANNDSGYVERFPSEIDLGVLLCFNEADGKFLWQHSNAKLPTGRTHDWPGIGVCSAALVDGDRLWYVNNRGQVVCLDTEGFSDGENDGPYNQEEGPDQEHEADVVWVFDMMKQLGVSQHNLANCSVTCAGDLLFVNTSNGVHESHLDLGADHAPSFICLSRKTGGIVWKDNSPGGNILHGQWSSPAYAVLGGVPQVIFGGGDGYLYGFLANGENGKSKLLWKFDCNPKDAVYRLNQATRNHIVATPVIYNGLVYVAVGEDPEHGEGNGHLWCVDPTKRGDVSPTLVFNNESPDNPIAHKRIQALVAKEGDFEKPNPNSAEVWHYVGTPDVFEKAMHRSISTVAIKNDLLIAPDFCGLIHCLDARTGKVHWVHDLLAGCWASPLIVDDRVYISDEDGDVSVFRLSSEKDLLRETHLGSAIFSTSVVANDTLFIASNKRLWALQEGATSAPVNGK